MADETRTVGIVVLAIVTAIRGVLGFVGAAALLAVGGAAGGSAGGVVFVFGLITAVLSFLLLFVAAGLWTGSWAGWVLGVVVFGLNALLGVHQFLTATAITGGDIVILAIDVVGLLYLVAVRNRFGSSGASDRSVPDPPHRR